MNVIFVQFRLLSPFCIDVLPVTHVAVTNASSHRPSAGEGVWSSERAHLFAVLTTLGLPDRFFSEVHTSRSVENTEILWNTSARRRPPSPILLWNLIAFLKTSLSTTFAIQWRRCAYFLNFSTFLCITWLFSISPPLPSHRAECREFSSWLTSLFLSEQKCISIYETCYLYMPTNNILP